MNSLKTRMQQHYFNGSIRKHSEEKHKTRITLDEILSNTKIIKKDKRKDLPLTEALLIKFLKPNINRQEDNFTRILKIF